jgi:plasmid stabilization system protein ParE
MRRYRVRLTPEAEEDLLRLYDFLLERDVGTAERALRAIEEAFRLLAFTPFSCRKAVRDNPLLRELVVPFGSAGYVALFEIDGRDSVTVLAVRHQREDDFH